MRLLSSALTVAVGLAAMSASAQIDDCNDCLTARLWSTTAGTFPEAAANARRKNAIDLGFAFSGGGTRSGSATTGQLRGLAHNGWLEKARYITAVSGGAWAAIPYTYTLATDLDLLGPFVDPGALQYEAVMNVPEGRMARWLGARQLPSASFKEAAWQLSSALLDGKPVLDSSSERFIKQGLGWLLSRREGERGEKTYSRFIADNFIDPIIDPSDKQASRRLFGWDFEAIAEAVGDNAGKLSQIDFLSTDSARRPFLIVGGTVVSTRDIYAYPLLMPIEYTGIYTGIRHRFGQKFGGTYISSWAYDHLPASPDREGRLKIHQGASGRKFTIADVAAASGSAPQLAVLLGKTYEALPSWARAVSSAIADFFPSFTASTVLDDRGVFVSGPTPHGDGGFTDNFGLMPLLARKVKNIIVFANVTNEYDKNDDLASYFEAVASPGPTGNKQFNVVFAEKGYKDIKAQFAADVLAGRPLVYCNTEAWSVTANPFYEIEPYGGVHICWVYIHAVDAWTKRITDKRLQALLATKAFSTFPWYDTFKQLKLDVCHVNLLADLTSWVMTDTEVVHRIRCAIPDLPEPLGAEPPRPCPSPATTTSAPSTRTATALR